MLDPLAQPEGLPGRPGSPRRRREHRGSLGRRSRARRPASRPPAAREDDVLELLAARDPDARAVEHQRGLRAERAVHERLQVAEPQEVVADPRAQPECGELRRGGRRAATARHAASGPRARGCGRRSRRRRASRPCRGSRRRRARSRRRMPSRDASTHSSSVTVTKRSRKRQADSSRRTPVGAPVRVALDDAARHVEVACGPGERRAVEPERVVVLRPQRGRRVAGDGVERRRGRRLGPVGVAPARSADPGPGTRVRATRASAAADRVGRPPAGHRAARATRSGNGRARP